MAAAQTVEKHFKDVETKSNRKSKIVITALVSFVIALAVLRVVVANRSVEASERLKNLDREIAKVESENQLMAEKLRTKESLLSLETKAAKMGFVKTAGYSFVKSKGPVAKAQSEFQSEN